jgi:aryl-alcohol dehydrogenase-like predicted oxidoreductase
MSTRLLFGAAAFYTTTESDVVKKTMDLLEEAGINHVDTAESYGESQKMLGPWIKHNRKKVFLATKTKYRTYEKAREDIRKSLDLLQTDSVDLWQMHCLAEPEEWEQARDRENGALRAFIEAREEGLVRFLGVTSHGMKAAAVLRQCLEEFPFASVLTGYNYILMQDQAYSRQFEELYSLCVEKKTALQLIKTNCRGPWPEETGPQLNTWYEPFTEQQDISTAVGWAMNREHTFINSSAEVSLLPKLIRAAQTDREPVTDRQMADLARRTGMRNLFV